jgi:hypothetical protein
MMKGKSMDKRHPMVVGFATSVMLSWSCPVLAHGPKHVSRTATSMGTVAGSIARTTELANMGDRGEPTPPHTSPTMILAAILNSE